MPISAIEARHFASIEAARWIRSDLSDGGFDWLVEYRKIGKRDAPILREQMVALAVELLTRAGVRCCRFCACSESDACVDGMGLGCSWAGPDRCTAFACRVAHDRETAKQSKSKNGAPRAR